MRAARVRLTGGGEGVTLRLADPMTGPTLGTARAYGPGGRYAWAEATVELAGVTGRHDLYVVFSAPGVALESLTFVP